MLILNSVGVGVYNRCHIPRCTVDGDVGNDLQVPPRGLVGTALEPVKRQSMLKHRELPKDLIRWGLDSGDTGDSGEGQES